MADFEAPPGPPPPKVPEGWIVRWNEQYKEWFYVNTYTKKSQWEKPTEPAQPPQDDLAPPGAPPSYTPGSHTPGPTDVKHNPFDPAPGNQPGASSSTSVPHNTEEEDARLARQLQAEEDARARAAHSPQPPYSSHPTSPFPEQLPPRPDGGSASGGGDKARGLLGKLFGGGKNKQSSSHGGGLPGALGGLMAAGSSHHGGGGHHQGGYGGYPGGAYGGAGGYGAPQYGAYPPQQPYGGYPPPGGYYPPQQQAYHGSSGRSGGMGAMGGAALGLGAGVLGGALIADAIDDGQDAAYAEGYGE
ncbi:hypothetical protein C8A03DRAFT_17676 [Achaetomium macrosporum]|uniref:WW domain-containing protein n=1 Tax=Achaetomium macrosporum TaxID=79813 RepID=A0AAN7H8W2_9PEZI|nr:hypothetical protein C8A03DRAFT_17676 [Achaetomium macrosporum]